MLVVILQFTSFSHSNKWLRDFKSHNVKLQRVRQFHGESIDKEKERAFGRVNGYGRTKDDLLGIGAQFSRSEHIVFAPNPSPRQNRDYILMKCAVLFPLCIRDKITCRVSDIAASVS